MYIFPPRITKAISQFAYASTLTPSHRLGIALVSCSFGSISAFSFASSSTTFCLGGNHYTIGNAWAYAVNNAPTDVAATQPAAAALPANTPYVGK